MAQPTAPVDPNLPPSASTPKAKPLRKGEAGVPLIAPRVKADALKPAGSIAIKRAGLGRVKPDGRRSGGQFSVKRLVILDTLETSVDVFNDAANLAQLEPDADRVPALDAERWRLPGVRELRVPLHLEPEAYPTLRDTEAVMEEYEEMYDSESARDRVLAAQVDPFWVNPLTQTIQPRSLGFGPFDPARRGNSDPNAGRAWLGTAVPAGVAAAGVE